MQTVQVKLLKEGALSILRQLEEWQVIQVTDEVEIAKQEKNGDRRVSAFKYNAPQITDPKDQSNDDLTEAQPRLPIEKLRRLVGSLSEETARRIDEQLEEDRQ